MKCVVCDAEEAEFLDGWERLNADVSDSRTEHLCPICSAVSGDLDPEIPVVRYLDGRWRLCA